MANGTMNASGNQITALIKVIEYFNETTERVQEAYQKLETRVKELNIYLTNILESMTSGVVVVDLDGRITVYNKAAEQITGYKSKQILGTPYLKYLGRNLKERQTPLFTLRTAIPLRNEEKEIIHAKGNKIPLRFSTSLLTREGGEVLGAVEVFEDLTEIKKLQEEIQQTKTLAALGEMAASVAHEIRNPLGGIGGFAALLERDLDPDDPRRRYVKKIIEGVASLDKIVTNLLIFTRPIKPRFRKIDIAKLVDEVLSFLQISLDQDKIPLRIVKDFPKEKIVAQIDSELFQELMLNLFRNAIQAMPQGGEMRIQIRRIDSKGVRLSISDTGMGMPEKVKDKLFYPFFTTKTRGTGLGLAIVKKIVEIHKGKIDIDSQENKGTTFTITLPD